MVRKAKKKKAVKKAKQELTNKQQMFCLYYIKNFNATQAYLKAFGCSYNTAMVEGNRALINPKIRKEITRLKKEKVKAIMFDKNDLVELNMRIAFAVMTDFIEWGRNKVPVMGAFGPVEVEDKETGEKVQLMREVNEVRFKESSKIDGSLVCQVKQGKDGASIKLEDRYKAIEWLTNFFEMNPMHKHKKEFDSKVLAQRDKELEYKLQSGQETQDVVSQAKDQLEAALKLFQDPQPNRSEEDLEDD